ncbi:hypothetical protein VOLCADRAFT_96171 [Volvox carteri f. nagariensis]|uniref:Uncharacterized protein n=1 Tax=Volvox carteri f. nagariensis TaxID=3068 RepID=D8U9E4_VOLCA|nr:uncharacterized protein VOLCADRAFT_96171 [Volvox carteri f. nagariensis]EFJ43626.1 hypothetical protein VOLCADRAFT_96171 [Volvox carteri f. nagariensis]|eukprot:XP_002955326.1 hypothetical protein VOLCADRAFT_96171 [Volvox carteri f. nagariensis]
MDPSSAVAVLWAVSRFERQRAAETAAAAAAAEVAAAAGDATAAAAVPLPPRRRRLSSLTPEELLLVADDLGFGFGFGADGRTPGASAGTPLALRPPRKWLVRYYPLIQDFAMAAAGVVPKTARATSTATSVSSPASSTISPGVRDAAGGTAAPPSRFAFSGLDSNQMVDLAVALADLYVYPGDMWMAAHEAHMALAGAAAGSSRSNSGRGRSGGAGASLTPYQWQLLMASYAALDDTAEEYAAPKAGEMY